MPHEYRLGQAAALLGVSVDTLRRWADAGRFPTTRDDAGHRVVDGVALAAFAAEVAPEAAPPPVAGRSARNRFPGIVTRVVRGDVAAQVEIQAGPHRFVSLLTREAVDDLGLTEGMLAVATVKATNVGVETVAEP
jgi:molybdopterin-binding protein